MLVSLVCFLLCLTFFFYFPITEGNVSYESSLVISLIVSQNDKISRDKTTETMIKIRLNGT